MGSAVFLDPAVGRVMGQQGITHGMFDRRQSGELGQGLSGRAFTGEVEDRPFILTNEVKQWSRQRPTQCRTSNKMKRGTGPSIRLASHPGWPCGRGLNRLARLSARMD